MLVTGLLAPAGGVRVRLLARADLHAASALSPLETYADGEGKFTFDAVPAGVTYDLEAHDTAGSIGRSAVGPLKAGGAGDVVVVLGASGSLEGRVVDREGAPLSGVEVVAAQDGTVWHRADDASSGSDTWARTTTNADGVYRLDGLPAGRVELTLRRAGVGARALEDVVVAPGAVRRLEQVSLARRGDIRGKVSWSDGAAAVDVLVVTGIEDDPEITVHMARTDAQGMFHLRDLDAEQVKVCVCVPGSSLLCERLRVGERVRRLRLPRPGVITGRVVSASGAPLPSGTRVTSKLWEQYQLYPLERVLRPLFVPGPESSLAVGPDGRFEVPALGEEHNWLTIEAPGHVRYDDAVLGGSAGARTDLGTLTLVEGSGDVDAKVASTSEDPRAEDPRAELPRSELHVLLREASGQPAPLGEHATVVSEMGEGRRFLADAQGVVHARRPQGRYVVLPGCLLDCSPRTLSDDMWELLSEGAPSELRKAAFERLFAAPGPDRLGVVLGPEEARHATLHLPTRVAVEISVPAWDPTKRPRILQVWTRDEGHLEPLGSIAGERRGRGASFHLRLAPGDYVVEVKAGRCQSLDGRSYEAWKAFPLHVPDQPSLQVTLR